MQLEKSVFKFCVLNYVSSLVFLGDPSCDSGLRGQPIPGQSVPQVSQAAELLSSVRLLGSMPKRLYSQPGLEFPTLGHSGTDRQFSRSLSLQSFLFILLAYLVLMETGPCLQLQNSWLPHVLLLLYWQDSWCGFHLSSLVKLAVPDC